MTTSLEYAAVGVVLLGAAAFGIARAAVHFRGGSAGGDRFFATSFTAVTLVALLVGGLFCLINAVIGIDGLWRLPATVAALAFAALLQVAVWRWLGPADRPKAAS